MSYLETESKRNSVRKIFSGTYIVYYVLRCLIHIGFPVMFFAFSPFNDFIGNTTNFFANSTDKTIETDIVLRDELTLQSWNPKDGLIADIESSPMIDHGVPCTRVRLKLAPVQSMFLVEERD